MKRLLYMMALLLGISACEKHEQDAPEVPKEIYDFYNYSVMIYVSDAETEVDLLNPKTQGNILDQNITMVYHGEEYPIIFEEEITRDSFYEFEGLVLTEYPEGVFRLDAGPFCTGSTENDPFTINWGDGTQTEFVVTSLVEWSDSYEPIVIRSLTMDGEPIAHKEGSNWQVTIYKSVD